MIINIRHICDSSLLTEQEKAELWEIVCDSNYEFVPPLSTRNHTLQQDLHNVINNEKPTTYFEHLMVQKWLVAKIDNHIVGFLSFIEEEYGAYISTVIVRKEYRKQDICRILYHELGLIIHDKKLRTRTWSTNDAHIHILQSIGFVVVEKIDNDRGIGMDTLYFEKVC
ncbi:MAG: GNAT family N-acetyltransferase [Agathobacter sp.]|nr:GNAT family N-acetyltransferase [Agathobacter sp.]